MEDKTPVSQRTKTACEECRKNKRKCDGDKPACGLCQKSRKSCVYGLESHKRKRQKFEDSYVRGLEEQVKTLTQLVDAGNIPTIDSEDASRCYVDSVPGYMTSHTEEVGGGTLTSGQDSLAVNARSIQAMEDLGSMMLKLDLSDQGEPNFTLSTSEPPLLRNKGHSSPKSNKKRCQTDESPENHAVPANPALKTHLVECFSSTFNRFHQLIGTDELYAIGTQDFSCLQDDVLFRNLAILAIGGLYSDASDAKGLSRSAADTAENLMVKCLKYNATPLVVQGLTLLSWFYLMLGNDMASWNFTSSATGLILRLGLHVTALKNDPLQHNVEQLELYRLRVRTFWCYFSIDRMITSTLGMNCTIPWQRVRVKPFISIVEDGGTLDERAFSRHGELWHLWDSFMDQMYAFDWENLTNPGKQSLMSRSYNALVVFYGGSPEELRGPPLDAPDSVICFQLAYHASVLLVHRPFLGGAEGSQTRNLALQGATTAAVAICRILREYRRKRPLKSLPPQTMNHIVCAAAIHLLNATSGRAGLGRSSSSHLRVCMDALLAVGDRWKSRQNISIRFIRKLAHKWKVVWALPLQFCAPFDGEEKESQAGPASADINSHVSKFRDSSLLHYPETSGDVLGHFSSFPDRDSTLELEWLFAGRNIEQQDDFQQASHG